MASEGLFVSGVLVGQAGNAPVASAESTQIAAAAAAPSSFLNSFSRQLGRMAVDSEPYIPWLLGFITALIVIALFHAFFVHVQIQQPEMLFSGILVAMFAFSLMLTNIHILGLL